MISMSPDLVTDASCEPVAPPGAKLPRVARWSARTLGDCGARPEPPSNHFYPPRGVTVVDSVFFNEKIEAFNVCGS